MYLARFLGAALLGAVVSAAQAGYGAALPIAQHPGIATNDAIIDVRAGRGGRGGAVRASGGRASVARVNGGGVGVARAPGGVSRANVNVRRNTNALSGDAFCG
jgi:hypothetical protein